MAGSLPRSSLGARAVSRDLGDLARNLLHTFGLFTGPVASHGHRPRGCNTHTLSHRVSVPLTRDCQAGLIILDAIAYRHTNNTVSRIYVVHSARSVRPRSITQPSIDVLDQLDPLSF